MKCNHKTILAIESSCDDTGIAIFKNGNLLSNVTSSQIQHQNLGGVVPEIASRAHLESIMPTLESSLSKSGLSIDDIELIAYTQGPGLLGSLLVGAGFAKGLSLSRNIPIIGINHIDAHVLAHFITDPKPPFPFLCLTVSGGHTQIVLMNDYFEAEILGITIDDAAGEAFDKAGKMLGLDYPAGPIIDKLAKEGTSKFSFSKPKIEGLDFSFSGLKTSILYFLRDQLKNDDNFINENLNDLCASVQSSIVSILVEKIEMALNQTGIKQLALAGGVSANSELRSEMEKLCVKHNAQLFTLPIQFCVDNAAMIGITAHFKDQVGLYTDLDEPIFTRQSTFQ